jgi:hypothetical protein
MEEGVDGSRKRPASLAFIINLGSAAPSPPTANTRSFDPRQQPADKDKAKVGESQVTNKGKAKAGKPRAARALRFVDEPEEPKVQQLKKRRLVKALGREAQAEKGKAGFCHFPCCLRKTGPQPMIRPVATYEALLANEPIAVKHLVKVLLHPIGATPTIAIPIDSISPRPLGPNIQHMLEEIEMGLKDSVGGGLNKTRAPTTAVG